MHSVAVRDIEQALFKETSGTVRDHTITLHLSESEATVTCSTLSGLSRENLGRSTTSRVDLIAHHMLQALIIGRVQEDHHFHALASEAVVHDLVTIPLVAQAVQLVRDVVDCLALERRGISFVTVETGHLTEDGFDHVTDSHTGWDSVRVDNHVRNDTLHSERQIFLPVSHSTGTFLTVTTGKLVTDLRDLDRTHLDFDEATHLLI